MTLVFVVYAAVDAERGANTAHLPVRPYDAPYLPGCYAHITQDHLSKIAACLTLHACKTLHACMQVLAPFAIGMDVFLCHMVAIPLDGCR